MLIIAEDGNIFDSHGMRAGYTHIDKEMVYLTQNRRILREGKGL